MQGWDAAHVPGSVPAKALGMVVVGAYPELDTYWRVRKEITDKRKSGSIFGNVFTRLVWELSDEKYVPKAWRFDDAEAFVLVKIKARHPSDDPTADPVVTSLRNAPGILGDFTLAVCGTLMGEWDNYALYTVGTLPEGADVKAIFAKLSPLLRECAHEVGITLCVVCDRQMQK